MVFPPLPTRPKQVPSPLPSLCELTLTTWQSHPQVFYQVTLKTAFAQKPVHECSWQSCAQRPKLEVTLQQETG